MRKLFGGEEIDDLVSKCLLHKHEHKDPGLILVVLGGWRLGAGGWGRHCGPHLQS